MKKLLTFLLFFSLLTFGAFGTMSSANAELDTKNQSLEDKGMTDTLCAIMKFVTGGVGKMFASFAVIFVGIGFLAGKTTWTAMITFALGIAAIFGAPSVIKVFTGDKTTYCGGSGSSSVTGTGK